MRAYLCKAAVLTLASASFFVFSSVAVAAPTEVNLRVEGLSSTLYEGKVTTDTNVPDETHECKGPSPTSALYDVVKSGALTWDIEWFDSFQDYWVKGIGGESGGDFVNTFNYWSLWINNASSMVGGCNELAVLTAGGSAVWADVTSEDSILSLATSAGKVQTGQPITTTVTKYDFAGEPTPAEGATVVAGGETFNTSASGKSAISFAKAGSYTLQAEKPGSIRSNSATVCVYEAGSSSCDAAPAAGTTPGGSGGGSGSSGATGGSSGGSSSGSTASGVVAANCAAPTAELSLSSKRRFSKRPRVLRGSVTDAGCGLQSIELRVRALARKGERCHGYDFAKERFSVRCGKESFHRIGSQTSWTYQFRRALEPGLYRVYLRATDSAGRVGALAGGGESVTFRVLNDRK